MTPFLTRLHFLHCLGATVALLVVTSAVLGAATAPLTPREREAATAFFAARGKEVAFRESGRQLWLANHDLGVEFLQTTNGLQLSRLVGAQFGGDFLTPDSAQSASGCWQLVLRRDRGRDGHEITVSSRDAAAVSACCEGGASARTLRLRWQGLAVASEPNALDVEVTVTLREDDPLTRWRINVTNRSKTYGLWEVVFPLLELAPIGGRSKTNHLVVPRVRGIVARDPFNQPVTDAWTPGLRFGPTGQRWPVHFNMQFQALYDESGAGLYMATHDGEGYPKSWSFVPRSQKQTLEYRVTHRPVNMGYPAEDYRMPFDVCIGPFRGDWYDACQIYRAWGIQQQWCRRGPLPTRSDIPRWYKETPLMLGANSSKGDDQVGPTRDRMLGFLRFIGPELPVHWTGWQQHVPEMTYYNKAGGPYQVPDKRAYPTVSIHEGNYPALPALPAFSAACKAISDAGGHVVGFAPAYGFDPGLNENAPLAARAKPNAARAVNGNIVEGADFGWRICPHTKWWQQRLAETVTELVSREHVSGIYWDVFYGGFLECFDTTHGHSHGGANTPYVGDQKLSEAVRGAMKKADPDAVVIGENSAEGAIDLLDGFVYHWTLWPDMAPLFATVYGDYIRRYTDWVRPDDANFYAVCATLFTEGAQMGRLPIGGDTPDWLKDFDNGSKFTDKMTFLRKLCRYYRPQVGGRYLVYGQLLRPMNFREPEPMRIVSFAGKDNNKVSIPALHAGVFSATDGTLGVFVVNVSDQPLPCRFELTPDRYPIAASKPLRLCRLNENGEAIGPETRSTGKVEFSGEISARDVIFAQIQDATPTPP